MDWQIEILQGIVRYNQEDMQQVTSIDGEYPLRKDHFIIRFRMAEIASVRLNALMDDRNYQRIQPGLVIQEPGYCFSPGTGLSEQRYHTFEEVVNGQVIINRIGPDTLVIDPYAHHFLYYEDDEDNRWSKVTFENGEFVLERDTLFLAQNLQGLEALPGDCLYLTLLVKEDMNEPIRADELKKLILRFS